MAQAIEEQPETATGDFNNSSEVVVLPEANKIMLSRIFNWYSRDFGSRDDLLRFLLGYLEPDDKAARLADHLADIQLEHLFHDWNPNH